MRLLIALWLLMVGSVYGAPAEFTRGISTTFVKAAGDISITGAYYGDGSHLSGISAGSSNYNSLTNVPAVLQNISNSTGSVTATSFSATTVSATNVYANSVSGSTGTFGSISGALSTASQPNITSLGTLTGLTVSGNVTTTLGQLTVSGTGVNNNLGVMTVGASGITPSGTVQLFQTTSANLLCLGRSNGAINICFLPGGTSPAAMRMIALNNQTADLLSMYSNGANASRVGINLPSGSVASSPLEVSGTVSATRFLGDGSGLTGLTTGGSSISTTTFTAASNISGSTSVGFNASAGTGTSNTTFGAYAGTALTTGVNNVAIGNHALAGDTTAGSNVAVGYLAASSCVTCSNLTAVGYNALGAALSSGIGNTALGNNSLQSLSAGSSNTGLGTQTLLNLTTGSGNIAIGSDAGGSLTGGSNNIVIGKSANLFATSASYQLNIGNAIYGNIGSGNFAGGPDKSNLIGINVSSPTTALEVSGTISATAIRGDGSGLTGLSGGGISATFLTSSGSFTTPANSKTTTVYKFTLTGGGGGSGGCGTTANTGSPGGSAAGTLILYASGIAPGTALTTTIGSGGSAGSSGPGAGGNGTSTTIVISSTTYTAGYGLGSSVAGAAGTAGPAGGTASGGTINLTGENGGWVISGMSGKGGASFWGAGAPQVSGVSAGTAAQNYGAGAGGCYESSSIAAQTGGAGKQGAILVEYGL